MALNYRGKGKGSKLGRRFLIFVGSHDFIIAGARNHIRGPGPGPRKSAGAGAKKNYRGHGPAGAGARKLFRGLGPAGAGA